MPKLWSEAPGARAREISADAATLIWVGLWAALCSRLYSFLSGLAKAGRAIREGGAGLNAAGEQIGEALGHTPVIGHRVDELIRSAFSAVSERFVEIGGSLERIILIMATLLAPVVLAISLTVWLQRYLPPRVERPRAIWAAPHSPPPAPPSADPKMERLPASPA